MASGGKTVDRDRGRLSILKRLRDAAGAEVTIGWHAASGSHPKAKMPMPQLAAIHEFGAPAANIPERSTLRATADAKGAQYRRDLQRVAARVVAEGASLRGELEKFGAEAASDVRQAITDFSDPPDAPATVARKGSSHPLIDTGAMRNAVSHHVKLGGRGV